jgi:CRP/FNR family cyclic AMP-dependent transcriptional regulator
MNSNMEENERGKSSELQDNILLLREIDFFSGLPMEVVKLFAYLCFRVTFKPGQYLLQQDEDDACAYYIISGEVELLRQENGLTESIRRYGADSFLGSLALFSPVPRLFSLRAVNDVKCLAMDRERFSKAVKQFPDIMPRLTKVIAERIIAWERHFILKQHDRLPTFDNTIGISLI